MKADLRLKTQLDALCRAAVFLRDRHRCRRCGAAARLQWCHVFSRRYLSLRWDLDNSFCACAGCHLWWHAQPVAAVAWWEGQIGRARLEALRLRLATPSRPDFKAVELYLGRAIEQACQPASAPR